MLHHRWILLIFSCFALTLSALAQDERIFIDYGACTKGVIAANGDTMIPPSFDNIRKTWSKIRNSENFTPTYWLATSGTERGLYNNRFELVVPLREHNIHLISDSLILVGRHRKNFQLYSAFHPDKKSHENLQSFQFISDDAGLLCSTQDSSFLYSNQLDLLQSFPYLFIQYYGMVHNSENNVDQRIFVVKKEKYGSCGIVDMDNNVIIPLEYSSIQVPRYPIQPAGGDAYLKVRKNGNKTGIYGIRSGLIIPCEYDEIQLIQLRESPYDSTIQHYAYRSKGALTSIQHLNTGKTTPEYTRSSYFEGYHSVTKGRTSYILNEFLEPIDSIVDKRYYFGRMQPYPRKPLAYPDSIKPSNRGVAHRADGVLFITDSLKQGEKMKKLKYQLRNIHSGAMTNEAYQWVQMSDYQGKLYYRGYTQKGIFHRYKWHNKSRKNLDIYTASLDLQYNYSVKNLITYNFGSVGLLQFENKDGKTGITHPNGDVHIPFEYDDIKFHPLIHRGPHVSTLSESVNYATLYDSFFVVTKNNRKAVMSLNGEVQTQYKYTSIQRTGNSLLARVGDSLYTYQNLEHLLSDSPSSRQEYMPPKKRRRRYKRSRRRYQKKKKELQRSTEYEYFEANDTVYVQVAYPDTIYAPKPVQSSYKVHQVKNWIVDSNGRILYHSKADYLETQFYQEPYYLIDKNKLVSIDTNGTVFVKKFKKDIGVHSDGNILAVEYRRKRRKRRKKQVSGLYDLDKKSMVIPMKKNTYTYLKPYKTVIHGNYNEGFKILDNNGEVKLNYTLSSDNGLQFGKNYLYLSYPENLSQDPNWLEGLLDTNFNFILTPGYYQIRRLSDSVIKVKHTLDEITLIKQDKRLSLGEVSFFPSYDKIIIKNSRDSVAFLDFNLNFTMPFTYLPELFKVQDLAEIHLSEYDTTFAKYAQVDANIPMNKQLLIKNFVFWETLQNFKFNFRYSPRLNYLFSPSKRTPFDSASVPRAYGNGRRNVEKGFYQTQLRKRTINLMGNLVEIKGHYDTLYHIYYPTKIRVQDGRKVKLVDVKRTFLALAPYTESTYFILTDTALIPLENFRFYAQEQRPTLDSLLLSKLNEKQALGLRCGNIEEEINHLEQHFELEKNGVRFYGLRNEYNLYLHYYELVGIWKNPYSLTQEQLLDESP